jgi:DNA repair protein RadD
MTVLWPFQVDVVDRVAAERAAGRKRLVVVAPTGAGKTVIGAEIIRREIESGGRVLFLAHRRELIRQAQGKLWNNASIDAGIIMAGFPMRLGEPVQIASVQSFHARVNGRAQMEPPPATLVVIDEAHRVRARSYRDILAAYPAATAVGLTATPCRSDGRGLGNVFESMVEAPQVGSLIDGGYLVKTRVVAPTRPDLTGVSTVRGDYHEGELEHAMDKAKLIGDAVENWLKFGQRRPTILFASGVGHSVHLRDEFRRAGILAEHLDGDTPTDERDGMLAKLARGEIEIITNCMVLTEGVDVPAVGCIVVARPTKSIVLYRQMLGRGLRTAPGKHDCIVIDHADVTRQHGFVEEPIIWTLNQDRRAENPANIARAQGKAPALVQCLKCHAVKQAGKPCTDCGWRPRPKPIAVDVVEGELAEFDRNRRSRPSGQDRRQFLRELMWIADEKGFKPGWAAHKYREKFGEWPSFSGAVDPAPPSDVTRSWVRSRVIAYAKAMGKKKAAA